MAVCRKSSRRPSAKCSIEDNYSIKEAEKSLSKNIPSDKGLKIPRSNCKETQVKPSVRVKIISQRGMSKIDKKWLSIEQN